MIIFQEERFMYPIYPLLAFAAALSVSIVLRWISTAAGTKAASTSGLLRGGALVLLGLIATALGVSRIASSHTNYGGKF